MNISDMQIEAAKRGETIRLTADDVEIVMVRADIFDQRGSTSDNPRATYAAILKAIDEQDEDTEQYLEYLDEAR